MKKKHLRMFRHILAGTMVLTSMVSVQAQVTNPETWSSFVESGANPSVVDTFRWQLFAKAEQNNWNYTLGGGAIISNDQKTLKMPLSSSVAFEKISILGYDSVRIFLGFKAYSLVSGEMLNAVFSNALGEERPAVLYPDPDDVERDYFSIRFKTNPYYLKVNL